MKRLIIEVRRTRKHRKNDRPYQFHFVIKSRNGKKLCTGWGYNRPVEAKLTALIVTGPNRTKIKDLT